MNIQQNTKIGGWKNKNEAVGRLLILSAKLDSERGEFKKLQNILGKNLYYRKNGRWFYNVKAIRNRSIPVLNNLSVEIENCINKYK